jgi:hypothetical protein
MLRKAGWLALLGVALLALAGCGGKEKDTEASAATKAVCEGSALSSTTKLPAGFPRVSNVTFTKQSTEGPTDVTEGFFMGSVKDGHAAFKQALGTNGYTVTHDELDEHDSEVNWQGHGRSGQVALREQCGENDKIYVHITNRPA